LQGRPGTDGVKLDYIFLGMGLRFSSAPVIKRWMLLKEDRSWHWWIRFDGIGVLPKQPKETNSLSKELIDDLCAALRICKARGSGRDIKGHRSKVFSAGHDIRELPTNGRDPLTYNDPLRHVVRAIEHFPAPVIAMIEGSVWGGACELVMSCDMIIAGDDSTFAITPAKRVPTTYQSPEFSEHRSVCRLQKKCCSCPAISS
jgi:hypothetical protein